MIHGKYTYHDMNYNKIKYIPFDDLGILGIHDFSALGQIKRGILKVFFYARVLANSVSHIFPSYLKTSI